ncbi:MAG TPA: hypothetical protein VLA77_01900 [Candidatus Saccharimonadales bacterium]|nr:hypothetical protein [Candidatus Saccharimonadales bacterium]
MAKSKQFGAGQSQPHMDGRGQSGQPRRGSSGGGRGNGAGGHGGGTFIDHLLGLGSSKMSHGKGKAKKKRR